MPFSVLAGVFLRYCLASTSLVVVLLLLPGSSVYGDEFTASPAWFSARHLLRAVCDEGKVAVGLTCVFCPTGKVKYPAGKNSIGVCQNAAIHCDEGQRGNNGVCTNCPDGMVPNAARNNCVHCPRGQAKKPAGQSPSGECVEGDQVCHKGQWVDEGVCANCPAGQAPTEDRTRCEFCPIGQVKHPPGTHKNGVCRSASKICDVGQIGDNGVCTNCGGTLVPNLGRTACEACPAGTIKDPPGTNANESQVFRLSSLLMAAPGHLLL
ncbi:hypothetical protein OEZ85_013653 [Tetradesmus obliquus]|uniref:Tyrosine-protein kinase ephrin type A/B receptor-like domain-containing protein n=1 Tax=Tetradesmus obliquus TaxID=3088 RepID=A0ABY8USE2_TETOB|nr:hypothetical protein OEZ85_013653 [Tetradesmus obliquus]